MNTQTLSPTETIEEWNRRYPRTGPERSIFTHFPPVAVPCPAWCTDPEGHSYELEAEDGAEMRAHRREFGDTGTAGVDIDQVFDYREGGEQPAGVPTIRVWIGGNAHEETIADPDQARRLAAALVEAADQLELLS